MKSYSSDLFSTSLFPCFGNYLSLNLVFCFLSQSVLSNMWFSRPPKIITYSYYTLTCSFTSIILLFTIVYYMMHVMRSTWKLWGVQWVADQDLESKGTALFSPSNLYTGIWTLLQGTPYIVFPVSNSNSGGGGGSIPVSGLNVRGTSEPFLSLFILFFPSFRYKLFLVSSLQRILVQNKVSFLDVFKQCFIWLSFFERFQWFAS